MAGPAPKNRDWHARENAHKPKGLHLIVTGLVEVSDANKIPVLTKGMARDPKILSVELSIKDCKDPAIQVPVWKHAYLHEEVKAGQYNRASIRWDGKEIANVEVIDDREHAAALTAMSEALDAKYAGKIKRAPVKKAPKKVAKNAAKKAPKKVAKKAAKKTKPKSVGGWAKAKKQVAKAAKKLVRTLTPKKTKKKAKKKGGR